MRPYSMGIAIVTNKDHDIDIYLILRYITQTVALLSPNKCMYIKNKVSPIVLYHHVLEILEGHELLNTPLALKEQ